jgi:uncharacterized coiled-coil protein SlyX
MNFKDFVVPAATVVFAAGASFASFESAAQETEDLDKRVTVLESKEGKQEIVDLKIEGIEKRLDKMEELMEKMLEVQQKQAINQAKICSATSADCD